MKFHKYYLGLLSLATFLPLTPSVTPSVNACAIVAPTTQVAVHGSQEPAIQQNQINTSYDENCFGNTVVAPTTQVGIGSGQVVQTNQGDYFVGGGDFNQTGLSSPVIQSTPNIQVDIQNPLLNNYYPQ